MVAEACDTLIWEKHPVSPPKWPEDIGAPVQVDQSWKGETETLREPPPPRRKMTSTSRPEKGGSPTKPEPWPSHSAWSPSPVVRPERLSALHARRGDRVVLERQKRWVGRRARPEGGTTQPSGTAHFRLGR